MAATVGTPSRSIRRSCALMACPISKLSWAWSGPISCRPLRLPPAKKVFLAEVMTTPAMESFSSSRRATASSIERP